MNMMWQNPNAVNAGNGNNANNSMVAFINNDSEAMMYPVTPGTTVALLNVNDPKDGRLYLKSAQMNGCPNPMRVFKVQDITPQRQDPNSVSRQEFDKVNNELQEIKNLLAGLNNQQNGGK
jgi:hypothetical protein